MQQNNNNNNLYRILVTICIPLLTSIKLWSLRIQIDSKGNTTKTYVHSPLKHSKNESGMYCFAMQTHVLQQVVPGAERRIFVWVELLRRKYCFMYELHKSFPRIHLRRFLSVSWAIEYLSSLPKNSFSLMAMPFILSLSDSDVLFTWYFTSGLMTVRTCQINSLL